MGASLLSCHELFFLIIVLILAVAKDWKAEQPLCWFHKHQELWITN